MFELEPLIAAEPDSPEKHRALARVYAALGRYQSAFTHFQATANRQDPQDRADFAYLQNLAQSYGDDKQRAERPLPITPELKASLPAFKSPKTGYSRQAKQLLRDLGIDYTKFNRYFDQALYEKKWGLKEGVFFDEATFGKNAVVAGQPETGNAQSAAVIAQFPLSEDARAALTALYTRPADYWQGKSKRERTELAHSTSYYDFLKNTAKLPESALNYLT